MCLGESVNPERVLLSTYLIHKKHVQVVVDLGSFSNTRSLQVVMNLPQMIFSRMKEEDSFGLRTLNCTPDHQKYNHNNLDEQGKCVMCGCFDEVINLEHVHNNRYLKDRMFESVVQDYIDHQRKEHLSVKNFQSMM